MKRVDRPDESLTLLLRWEPRWETRSDAGIAETASTAARRKPSLRAAILAAAVAIASLTGCPDDAGEESAATQARETVETIATTQDTESTQATETAEAAAETLRFTRTDDDRSQVLRVRQRPDGQIAVEASITGACERRVMGIAEAPEDGDPGTYDDPEGEAVPVDTYLLQLAGDCALAISLAWETQPFAWISEGGCDDSCRFSAGPMVRQDAALPAD